MNKKPDSCIKAPRALVFMSNKLTPAPTTRLDEVWERLTGNEILPPSRMCSLGKSLGLKTRTPANLIADFIEIIL